MATPGNTGNNGKRIFYPANVEIFSGKNKEKMHTNIPLYIYCHNPNYYNWLPTISYYKTKYKCRTILGITLAMYEYEKKSRYRFTQNRYE